LGVARGQAHENKDRGWAGHYPFICVMRVRYSQWVVEGG
jgi:hypothetical protein